VIEPIKEAGVQDYRLDAIERSELHPAAIDRLTGRRLSGPVDYSGGELPGRKVDGRRWIGLGHRTADQDPAAFLEEILGEADALIRQRLEERAIDLPHLVVAVSPEGKVVLRSNASLDVLRWWGPDEYGRWADSTAEAGRHEALIT
jgi:hypothetical protein